MLVIRTDSHYDYVDDSKLDGLIKSKEIVKYKRNTEWVSIGAAPLKRERVMNSNDRLAINDAIFVHADSMANK